jgi:hypothetical protein
MSLEPPPADAVITALAVPLFMRAGAVNGVAVVLARAGDALYYLVDNAPAGGPPVWVHEGLVDACFVAELPAHAPEGSR